MFIEETYSADQRCVKIKVNMLTLEHDLTHCS